MIETQRQPETVVAARADLDYDARVRTAWSELQQVIIAGQCPQLLPPLQPLIERFDLGLFRLVVMGEIKKGKSSFLNALLGEPDLLPTASDVATSTVYKVLYGPEKKLKVFFLPDVDSGKRPAPLAISSDQLAMYGTEAGNPDNRHRVDFIGVELPHPLLEEGLVLVDTPGVGGLCRAHRDITWKYAPNADAVFFVLDSVEAVISDDEVQFLRELTSKVTQRIYFVQTKTDIAGTDQWQSWRDRNLAILAEKLKLPKDRIAYFPVSSKLKNLADKRHSGRYLNASGYLAVLDFLHHGLMQVKHRLFASEVAHRLLSACKDLRCDFTEQLRLVQCGSREELERISHDYSDARRQFDDWHHNAFQQEMRRFGTSLADIKQRVLVRLQEDMDPAGPIVVEILTPLRQQEFDPKVVNDLVGKIQQDCLARAAEYMGKLQTEFNCEVANLMRSIVEQLAQGLMTDKTPAEIKTVTATPQISLESTLGMHFSYFEDLRTCLYGGMAGGMIANIGFGLLATLFPPAGAIAGLAMLIGGCIGGAEAKRSVDARRREEALGKLKAILMETMRKVQRQALNQFNDMVAHCEQHARDVLNGAVERHQAALQTRLQQIEQARSRSREENQSKIRDVENRLQTLQRIESLLTPLVTAPESR